MAATLASAVGLASIVGPPRFLDVYFVVQKRWPGAIWLLVVAIYAIAVPLIYLGTCSTRSAQHARA